MFAVPGAAARVRVRVRTEFADVLDAPESRTGQLVACAELLQAAPRVAFYADLEAAVRTRLASLDHS
jgi:hypothetical protein